MAWTIEVEPEKAAQIEGAAARQGLTPEQFVTAAALRAATATGEAAQPGNGSAYNGALAVNSSGNRAGEESHPALPPVPEWASELRAAAASGDENDFIAAWRQVEPDALTAPDFELATCLALQAGAHVLAREIAQEGARRYPNDLRLQKRARLLAPPRAVGAFPADPAAAAAQKADHEWMRAHGSEHRGQWIALRHGQLLGAAPTLRELREQLQRAGVDLTSKPFLTKIH